MIEPTAHLQGLGHPLQTKLAERNSANATAKNLRQKLSWHISGQTILSKFFTALNADYKNSLK
jgi:hypothetical protein